MTTKFSVDFLHTPTDGLPPAERLRSVGSSIRDATKDLANPRIEDQAKRYLEFANFKYSKDFQRIASLWMKASNVTYFKALVEEWTLEQICEWCVSLEDKENGNSNENSK